MFGMAMSIAEGSDLPMYTDIYALEHAAFEHRSRAEAQAAQERQISLLPARPSRVITFLRRIGAVRSAPIQGSVENRPVYRPAARPIPAR